MSRQTKLLIGSDEILVEALEDWLKENYPRVEYGIDRDCRANYILEFPNHIRGRVERFLRDYSESNKP